ncbi:hypothetical protein ATKI12_5577 [Kitasatospora sp. Ki12]
MAQEPASRYRASYLLQARQYTTNIPGQRLTSDVPARQAN